MSAFNVHQLRIKAMLTAHPPLHQSDPLGTQYRLHQLVVYIAQSRSLIMVLMDDGGVRVYGQLLFQLLTLDMENSLAPLIWIINILEGTYSLLLL